MIKKRYKAVIFDFDDTLVESRAAKWAQHKHVAKKFYNIDLTDETLAKHWGKSLDVLISEAYQYSDTLENMYVAVTSTRHDFPKKVYEESISVINKLLDNGIKIGVLSATTKNFLSEDLNNLGFPADRMTVVQGADETLVHKPNPKVFLPILNQLKKEGIKRQNIVYVGDSLNDLQAAHGAGIDFIAITTGLYSYQDLKKEGAKTIVKNIREIIKFLIN